MTRKADLVLGDRYRLLEPIAAGGMGTVWRAEDERLGRRVAVKVLNDGLAEDPRFLERFRREAQAAAGLSHPNVAGVFDYGEDGSRPYIVMELVEGQTLAERLAAKGPLPPKEAARIAASVSEGLAEAHEAGVVHRDVKPANVILSRKGTKVTDFGIASSGVANNLTATGMVMGTARYLSPEQARGDKAGPASDIYAVGVLLYEMLTGAPPFDHETPVATAMAHVRETPRPVREVRPEVPPDLAAIAEACLAKDPADRPGSANVLARELREAAGGTAAGAVAGPEATTQAIRRDPTDVLPAAIIGTSAAGGERLRRAVLWRWMVPLLLIVLAVAALFLVVRLARGGGPQVAVPTFQGLTRAQAQDRAARAGLEVSFLQNPDGAPAGTVIGQSPPAGTRVSQGETISLIVSKGPPLVIVPGLTDLVNEDDVIERLTQAGLEFDSFRTVEQGTGIVGTIPEEGSQVPAGTKVVVVVGTEGHDNGPNDGKGDDGKGDDGKGKDGDKH
ncbi:MAG: protein kinase [Actinobacteria bacterium]|nr:protein kinase [Actinomycetota bacterium]